MSDLQFALQQNAWLILSNYFLPRTVQRESSTDKLFYHISFTSHLQRNDCLIALIFLCFPAWLRCFVFRRIVSQTGPGRRELYMYFIHSKKSSIHVLHIEKLNSGCISYKKGKSNWRRKGLSVRRPHTLFCHYSKSTWRQVRNYLNLWKISVKTANKNWFHFLEMLLRKTGYDLTENNSEKKFQNLKEASPVILH